MAFQTKQYQELNDRLIELQDRVITVFDAVLHIKELMKTKIFKEQLLPLLQKDEYRKELENIRDADKNKIHEEFTAHLICRAVDFFKLYLVNVIGRILKEDKALVKNFIKEIDINKLFEADSIDDIINDKIDDTVFTLSFKGFRELITELNTKLATKIDTKTAVFKKVSLMIEVRNLIVHADGVVDKKFIAKCKKIDPSFGEKRSLIIGKKFPDLYSVFTDSHDMLTYASDLDATLIEKFDLDVIADVAAELSNKTSKHKEVLLYYGKAYKPKQICPCSGSYTLHGKFGKATSEVIRVEKSKRFPASKIKGATYKIRVSITKYNERKKTSADKTKLANK